MLSEAVEWREVSTFVGADIEQQRHFVGDFLSN